MLYEVITHDLVIIGSGPAGLTAAIYASRAKLAPLCIEGGDLTSVITSYSIHYTKLYDRFRRPPGRDPALSPPLRPGRGCAWWR